MATQLHDGYRRFESNHGVACEHRDAGSSLVRRQYREISKRVLRLSFVHFRRRNRRVCINRFIFLLRISRARAYSHIFVDRNLGKRKSRRSSVENYDLSCHRQFYSAVRFDLALPKRSGPIAQLRHSRPHCCRFTGPNRSRCTTSHLPLVAYRFWNSHFALPVSHMGTGSLCVGSCAGGYVACRGAKKIWSLRPFASGYSSPARGRAPLDDIAYCAAPWKHHLRGAGHNCPEAAGLDARLLKRDAHGLHFSWNRQRWHSGCDRRSCIDVCSWSFNCAAICPCRRITSANGHLGFR